MTIEHRGLEVQVNHRREGEPAQGAPPRLQRAAGFAHLDTERNGRREGVQPHGR